MARRNNTKPASSTTATAYVSGVNPADMACPDPLPDELLERAQEEAETKGQPVVEDINQDPPTLEDIQHLLDRIPPREADLLYLYFIAGKRQAEIATIFEVTQAAISYRIDRALHRIKFLRSIPFLDPQEMLAELPAHFNELDTKILIGMWETTCQSEVAKLLGQTQGRVRHRFFDAVKRLAVLKDTDYRMVKYHKVFAAIGQKNFNVARSVVLPQWSRRGQDKCG